MWKYSEQKTGSDISKYTITQNNKALTYIEAIDLLCSSKEFRVFLIELLKSSLHEAYFWEVRPVTTTSSNEDFEFALVNAPALLKITADNSSFVKYFSDDKYAVSFFNLSGDAKLIVPVEMNNSKHYNHIANFVRNAPLEQVDLFWQKVGKEIKNSIGETIKWVSTSGLGVHWLHIRIDTKPKYYSYLPYKTTN